VRRAVESLKLPRIIIPVLVALALVGGYSLRLAFTQPTLTKVFADQPGEEAIFVVDGIRCWGTAQFFTSLYEDTPGVLSIQAYASERTAVFTFDPSVLSRARIQAIMEAPIPFDDGTTHQVYKCVSVR
jgi:hypothetical protein